MKGFLSKDQLSELSNLFREVLFGFVNGGNLNTLDSLLAETETLFTDNNWEADIYALSTRIQGLSLQEIKDCFIALVKELQLIKGVNLRSKTPADMSDTFRTAIGEMMSCYGNDSVRVENQLREVRFTPVMTAHPTQGIRKVIRDKLLEIRDEIGNCLANETPFRGSFKLRQLITTLYGTNGHRKKNITVQNEMDDVLAVMENFVEAIPELLNQIRAVLREFGLDVHCMDQGISIGNWVTGDRDGNPFVTPTVTRGGLQSQQNLLLKIYCNRLESFAELCSMGMDRIGVSEGLNTLHDDLVSELGSDDIDRSYPREQYRSTLLMMRAKIAAKESTKNAASYLSPEHFLEDLMTIRQSLMDNGCEVLTQGGLQELIDIVSVCGFHLAKLDVRQSADKHSAALLEILSVTDPMTDFDTMEPSRQEEFLARNLESNALKDGILNRSLYSEGTKELLDVFRVIAEANDNGHRIKYYLISQAQSARDVLTVVLFLKAFGLEHSVQAVPLFETPDDLSSADDAVRALLNLDVYKNLLGEHQNTQVIMLGYSDSARVGGTVCSNYSLYKAQRELTELGQQMGIRIDFFHGRGGTIGRGGHGSQSELIGAQPVNTVSGKVRVTVQGEMIWINYAHEETAISHVLSNLSSIISMSYLQQEEPMGEWVDLLQQMSEKSYGAYRKLVEHQDFPAFLNGATHLLEMELLGFGSRPAKRPDTSNLDGIRAIPWVMAFIQNASGLAGLYGLGTALALLTEQDPRNLETLKEMYLKWPFFRINVIQSAEIMLMMTDLRITREYVQNLAKEEAGTILELLEGDYANARTQVANIIEKDLIDDKPGLKKALDERRAGTTLLHLLQVEVIKRMRFDNNNSDTQEWLQELFVQSVLAILTYRGRSG